MCYLIKICQEIPICILKKRSGSIVNSYPLSDYCSGNYKIKTKELAANDTGFKGILTSDASSILRNYTIYSSCEWNIESSPNTLIKFTWDYVFAYDGATKESTIIASLTGYRTYSNTPKYFLNSLLPTYRTDKFISSSNALTIYFFSDELIGDVGFRGTFEVLSADEICKSDADCGSEYNSGYCLNGKCECFQFWSGKLCEKPTTGYKNFIAREQHSVAYDPLSDRAFISFGKSYNPNGLGIILIDDILIYDFKKAELELGNNSEDTISNSSSWSKINFLGSRPKSRYSHYTFFENGIFYLVGGIGTSNIQYIEIWSYDSGNNIWRRLPVLGNIPPSTENPQIIHVPKSNSASSKIYAYGGLRSTIQGSVVENRMYCYDLELERWILLNQNGIALYGASSVYHPETNSIYFVGGYRFQNEFRVQKYSISSNLWYNVGDTSNEAGVSTFGRLSATQIPQDQRTFAKGVYLENFDKILVFGGQTPGMTGVQELLNVCYQPFIQIFDVACGKWYQYQFPELEHAGRSSHGMVLRNNKIWVIGGQNGDMFSFDLNLLKEKLPQQTEKEVEQCKTRNWCRSGDFYTCKDCLERSYCGWRSNQCYFNTQDALSSESCPTYIPISLGRAINGTLNIPGEKIEYEIYIDRLNFDVHVSLTGRESKTYSLQLYSGSYSSMKVDNSPNIVLTASDPNRYVGPYIIQVKLLMSSDTNSLNSTVPFTLLVSSLPPTGINYPSASPINNMDVTSMVTVFTISMSIWMMLNLIGRRIRERAFWFRLAREQELIWKKTPIPKFYRVTIGLPKDMVVGEVGNKRKKKNVTDSTSEDDEIRNSVLTKLKTGISGFLSMLNLEPRSQTNLMGNRNPSQNALEKNNSKAALEEGNIDTFEEEEFGAAKAKERNSFSNFVGKLFKRNSSHLSEKSALIELKEQKCADRGTQYNAEKNFKIVKTSVMKVDGEGSVDQAYPLSIECIPPHPLILNVPPLVAMHYTVIFPDAEHYVSQGYIPPMQIGTTLHVDSSYGSKHKGTELDDEYDERIRMKFHNEDII
ncbi:hypothetical protein HK099_002368 [Clydaea vesicula]|uniref:CUB domain-containing protein n=1 Tax=Clydaea vesicula TaxID=447962 RepID=A0AAD5U719_9FUNG|nr:hypothetical protein HK099_002368 [Clydaea vesicula]